MLGSILTHQYRIATRGISLTLRGAQQALGIAGGVVDELVDRLGLRHGDGESEVFSGEVVPDPGPRAEPAPAEPAKPHGDPLTRAPAASAPPPATSTPPTSAPRPSTPRPAAPRPAATEPPSPPPPAPEPAHVSTEAEVVQEFADPGAEDGAGAQVRIVGEPWPGYRHLKARDVIARLTSATREELAAVELFELSGANRKSVVAAAQRALKQASPPRGATGQ